MKVRISLLAVAAFWFGCTAAVAAQQADPPAPDHLTVTIDTQQTSAPISKYLYGGFIEHGGTLEHFAGDGMMVFFNDPVPQPDHAERAVRMAVAMREPFVDLASKWAKLGFELGFGVGIATGIFNAFLIRVLRLPSIVATLGTLSVLEGAALLLRAYPQGAINSDVASTLTSSVSFVPIAFVGVVRVRVTLKRGVYTLSSDARGNARARRIVVR